MHTFLRTTLFLSIAAAWALGCGPSMPPVKKTAKGVLAGAETKATIGAAGGTLQSSDGLATLVVPAGALAADVELGLAPIENLSPGGLGRAYRLTPDGQTFDTPVTLTVPYELKALEGTPVAALAFATQRDDGAWELQAAGTVDETARTVTGSLKHFSDWSAVKEFNLRPPSGLVKVGQTLPLAVLYCFAPPAEGELVPLGFDCDASAYELAPLVPTTTASNWSVNGMAGGSRSVGTVVGNGTRAVFTAPSKPPPTPSTVAVSAELATFGGGQTLVVANLTIFDNLKVYSGTFSARSPSTLADVTYTVDGSLVFKQERPDDLSLAVISGTMQIDYRAKDCEPYSREHQVVGATLDLDTPADGEHSVSLGIEAIELTCNGATLGAVIPLHPCTSGPGGSKPAGVGGEATCSDGTYTWGFARQ